MMTIPVVSKPLKYPESDKSQLLSKSWSFDVERQKRRGGGDPGTTRTPNLVIRSHLLNVHPKRLSRLIPKDRIRHLNCGGLGTSEWESNEGHEARSYQTAQRLMHFICSTGNTVAVHRESRQYIPNSIPNRIRNYENLECQHGVAPPREDAF